MTSASTSMMCLSIRQPWAWLIVNGWKNIENRDWSTKIRGPILIHASSGMTEAEYRACILFIQGFTWCDQVLQVLPDMKSLKRGGIVGGATLLDCVEEHSSDWFCGPYGFVLAEQYPLPFQFCKGHQRWFKCPCEKPMVNSEERV